MQIADGEGVDLQVPQCLRVFIAPGASDSVIFTDECEEPLPEGTTNVQGFRL